METNLFDYHLPPELIAQEPFFPRDHSRLMILNRADKTITQSHFYNLPDFLTSNDILVFNQTKVIPARLYGHKENGAKVELVLLKKLPDNSWEALTKPGLKESLTISFDEGLRANIIRVQNDGNRIIRFNETGKVFDQILHKIGTMPTPPYIKTKLRNADWYQTIYARQEGSAAAPTAGFHFTEELFRSLEKKGVQKEFVTLHVGLDTFRPVRTEKLEEHEIHSEWCEISEDTVQRLNDYKQQGKRIIAVGTTSVRTLESAAETKGHIRSFTGNTQLFIYPPYEFKFVDAMITNFHLPKSTLLALVSAFAGREYVLKAYKTAIEHKYRFFSFGDGMLII